MSITVYQYPRCSTCRKALTSLDERGVMYESIDLVEKPPSQKTLTDLWKRSGLALRAFFNTSGESYREGGFKDKLGTMSEAQQLKALAADGKLIKRPIIDAGDVVLVGYREEELSKIGSAKKSSKVK